jgi:hypothetical protein
LCDKGAVFGARSAISNSIRETTPWGEQGWGQSTPDNAKERDIWNSGTQEKGERDASRQKFYGLFFPIFSAIPGDLLGSLPEFLSSI